MSDFKRQYFVNCKHCGLSKALTFGPDSIKGAEQTNAFIQAHNHGSGTDQDIDNIDLGFSYIRKEPKHGTEDNNTGNNNLPILSGNRESTKDVQTDRRDENALRQTVLQLTFQDGDPDKSDSSEEF